MEKAQAGKNDKLVSRILFTLFMLAIYRVGVHVPTPGVDSVAVLQMFQSQSRGVFSLFNTFTGGALAQFSIFALGIMPYISASIIFQLLTSAVPSLEALKKEGESGRKKISQYTRYATVVLCLVQGYGISTWLLNSTGEGGIPLVTSSSVSFLPFQVMSMVTLTAGACFVMWIGEQITEKGIGNGSSLIIFTGIAASVLNGASQMFKLIESGELSFLLALLICVFMVVVIGFVVFMEVAQRKLVVQYSQRSNSGAHAMSSPNNSHLPIKVNFSGVIPPIFASSLLMFPATLAQFVHVSWLKSLQDSLSPNGVLYNVCFVSLLIFFCFFYTEIVFNPNDVADNLKKYGGFIPGIRAGKNTAEYIKSVLDRVSVLGAIYLSLVCILPGLLTTLFNVPFYFGGTSLLILVGVAIDTSSQIQSYMITQKYGSLSQVKIKRRVQY